ncbi:MAG: AAA family ATPase [Solibacillus sp.]
MYLKKVSLSNWRKYKADENNLPGLVVHFKKGLNILIGENDSGKTAIIDAIKTTLGTNNNTPIWISDEDFSKDTSEIFIECIFDGLTPKEQAYFLEWLTVEGNEFEKTELRITLKATKYQDINNRSKINKELLAGPDGYESSLPGIAQEYLRTTYLKPLRDAESELKPGYRSRVSKIIEGLDAFKSEENKEEITKSFKEAFQNLESKLKSPVTDKIDGHLKTFLSKTDARSANITEKEIGFIEVLRRLELKYDDIKSGLGSMNLLFMALELIALKNLEIGSQITLIEEIEAHLHPQAQLRVIKAFEKYLNEHPELDAQYILSTHSTTLASSVNLKNLIVLYKDNAYPMDSEYTELVDEDYLFLNRFLDATKSNLFFAKGVILVEGYAENILIPAIAEAIGRPLHQYGISIINVQGTVFERYLPIFLRKQDEMNFPVSVITDLDIGPTNYYIKKDDDFSGSLGVEQYSVFNSINTPLTMREIKNKIDENWTNKIAEQYFEYWKYTAEEIELVKNNVVTQKKAKYKDGEENIKVFFSKPWTLEHSIGKSFLKDILEKIILDLREYQKENTRTAKLLEWTNTGDSHQRATLTYQFILNNSLSKSIIAQRLAEEIIKLESAKINLLKTDLELKHLVQAIEHVTGGN